MVLNDFAADPRLQANATTAKQLFSNLAMGGAGVFAESGFLPMYGTIKSLKFWASNTPTDATFTVTIRDIDDGIVYTSGAINKNQVTFSNLTHDNSVMVCGLYKVRFSFSSSQTLGANNFQLLPIFK